MISKLQFKRRLTGYRNAIGPLVIELFTTFLWRTLFVIVSSIVAVALELLAMAVLYFLFTSGADTKGIIGRLSQLVVSSDSGSLIHNPMLFMPIILFGCAAIVHVISSIETIRLASAFGRHSFQSILDGLNSLGSWPVDGVTREFASVRKINRVQKGALLINARIVRILISILKPLLLFIGGYILLLYINVGFGLTITLVIMVIMVFQGVIGLQSARNNIRWESVAPTLSGRLKNELNVSLKQSEGVYDYSESTKTAGLLLEARKKILSMGVYSQGITSIGFVVTLAVILLYFRYWDTKFIENNISATLTLLVIIVRVFMSFRDIARELTIINRFYPQLSRYARLMTILRSENIPLPEAKVFSSRSILTDLEDNKVNRLRWKAIMFDNQAVQFNNRDGEMNIDIYRKIPEIGFDDKRIWVDMEDMNLNPPVLCEADNQSCLEKYFSRNSVNKKPATTNEDDDEDDF